MMKTVLGTTEKFTFNTLDQDREPVAPSAAFEAADFVVLKNGVARDSVSGITVESPYGDIAGLHQVLIDTSDDDDEGFYELGEAIELAFDTDKTADGVALDGRVVGVTRLVKEPASAGDEMDLVDAPNSTAVAAIQNGLSTLSTEDVAAAVLDADPEDHDTEGTFGHLLQNIEGGGGGGASIEDIAELLPDNFAALGITEGGAIENVVSNADMRGTDNAALAATALSTAQWTSTRAGYLDRVNTALPNAAPGANGGLPTVTVVGESTTVTQIVRALDHNGNSLGTLSNQTTIVAQMGFVAEGLNDGAFETQTPNGHLTAAKFANNAITGDKIAASAATKIRGDMPDVLALLLARFFQRLRDDKTAKTITLYAEDGTTPLYVWSYESNGFALDLGAAQLQDD